MSELPSWLALFAPLPEDAELTRQPAGEGEAIAGWQQLVIFLADPDHGLRNVLVVVDGDGRPLSAGDWVMVRRVDAAGVATCVHDNVGGRLEPDGRFLGTRWHTVTREVPDSDESERVEATPSPPSAEDTAALHALVAEILARASALAKPGPGG